MKKATWILLFCVKGYCADWKSCAQWMSYLDDISYQEVLLREMIKQGDRERAQTVFRTIQLLQKWAETGEVPPVE